MEVNLKHELKPGIIQINLDKERWYKVENEDTGFVDYYPSVTWILEYYPKGIGFKKYLMNLADEAQGKAILEAAGDRGSKVHWGIEQLLRRETLHFTDIPFGYTEQFNANEWKYILTFMNWYDKYKPITIGIEDNIIEPNIGFGGTADYICRINDLVYLVDWKTSAHIYDTHKIQAAAYAHGYPSPIDKVMIVKLGHPYKDGYQIWEEDFDNLKEYYELFKATYKIWEHENKNIVPRFMECPEELTLLEDENAEERYESENIGGSEGENKDREKI